MPIRIGETILAFGKSQQAAIGTANITAALWRLNKVNRDLVTGALVTEDDRDELGKGVEFVENVYPVSRDCSFTLEKYLSSQIAAWAFAFGFGSFEEVGAGDPYTYTCVPLDPADDIYELPYFSYLEEVREDASPIYSSKLFYGCVVKGFSLEILNGVGRAASKITINCQGSGKVLTTGAHGLTIPAATAETLLPASSLTLTSLMTDYSAVKRVLAFRMTWDNGVDDSMSFAPGGGVGALGESFRSQQLVGNRAAGLSLEFEILMAAGAVEDAAIAAGTTGTLIASVSNGADDTLTITFQKIRYESVIPSEGPTGFVKLNVKALPMWHSTNGLVTAVVKTNITGICAPVV